MSTARPALAALAIAGALALAGCKSERAPTARSIQSLPAATVALMSEKGMTKADPILLKIYKEESKAELWKKRKADGKYALLKSYDICRWSGHLGPKIKEGDKQAPEGFYSVSPGQMNPRSSYYLSFNIGFPNAYDRALGRTGRHLMVHGDCLSAGCYAMTDAQIAEIYSLARESFAGGQKAFQVQALPFRMTAENMARRRNNPNIAFWKNLKQGSDHFEVTKLEPKVDACGKKYVFNAETDPTSRFEPTAQCPTFQVQPQAAQLVAAKERADNAVIAKLTATEAPAPEYLAQNGRIRRSLDEPIVRIAAPIKPDGETPVLGGDSTLVALRTPAPTPRENPQRALAFAPAAPSAAEAEESLFARMLRTASGGAVASAPSAPVPATSSAPASPETVASIPAATRAVSARPAVRQIAPLPPVMASSVGPSPSAQPESGFRPTDRLRGLVDGVGGLFGGGRSAPAVVAPTEIAPPLLRSSGAPKPRDRSARMPAEFMPKSDLDPRITSAFAAFE